MPKRPRYVEEAEALHDDHLARIEEDRQALEAELTAAGVQRWWPYRNPGMSLETWLDELGKATERQGRNGYVTDRSTWRPR